MPADTQNALAGLRRWSLVRDDSGPHRVYRDELGNTYASSPTSQRNLTAMAKDALDRWIQNQDCPGAIVPARDSGSRSRGVRPQDSSETRVIALTSEKLED